MDIATGLSREGKWYTKAMKYFSYILAAIFIVAVVIFLFARGGEKFNLPRGETMTLEEGMIEGMDDRTQTLDETQAPSDDADFGALGARLSEPLPPSTREILVTDGTKHSIPLDEILRGGPAKDGIPSIDNPKFLTVGEASFLEDSDVGLGLVIGNTARFYPYKILTWHEIANDVVEGNPILVTYCPLCRTGIVFDRTVDGETLEFGVSGLLWQSNLLMYDRQADEQDETLWSQVLGEAVLGPQTGMRLAVVSSDTVLYGDWKAAHPDTQILSRETGAVRNYDRDPYEGYYESLQVGFGATFDDTRLHPKAFVFGIEIGGQFKAYADNDVPKGTTLTDSFAGKNIRVEKNSTGVVNVFADDKLIPTIDGFWFSWLAVHPGTELYEK